MKSAPFILIILLSFFSIGQKDDFIDCNDISENFTGECKSYFNNGNLGTHLIVENGKIVVTKKYFLDGSKYLSVDKSQLKDYSYTKEILYSNRKKHQAVEIENGSGIVKSYRKNGSLLLSGEVKDKKLIFPWLIFNDGGEPIDTIGVITYNKKIGDHEAFAKMIDEAFFYAKIRSENYQLRKKNPNNQVLPPIDMQMEEAPIIDIGDGEEEKNQIVDYPDVEAQFPGGRDSMQLFLIENLSYPEIAIENKQQGKVFIEFTVNTDGSIENISILRGVSKEINEEAKRVVRLMPNWIPGQVKEEPVNTRIRIPINFTLDTNKKD